MSPHAIGKAAWVVAGTACLALGVAGALLPLLPATPFFLLSAACYLRGSRRMHDWLVNHRVFGGSIRAFREGRGIPARAKAAALAMLWTSLGFSMYVAAHPAAWTALAAIGGGVSTYLLRLPTTAA